MSSDQELIDTLFQDELSQIAEGLRALGRNIEVDAYAGAAGRGDEWVEFNLVQEVEDGETWRALYLFEDPFEVQALEIEASGLLSDRRVPQEIRDRLSCGRWQHDRELNIHLLQSRGWGVYGDAENDALCREVLARDTWSQGLEARAGYWKRFCEITGYRLPVNDDKNPAATAEHCYQFCMGLMSGRSGWDALLDQGLAFEKTLPREVHGTRSARFYDVDRGEWIYRPVALLAGGKSSGVLSQSARS